MGFLDTILYPLYYAVSWVIIQFHKVFGAIFGDNTGWAWGLSIVGLTVLIRAAMIPLFVKQIKSMRTMQALQPKMKVIQERYKNDRQKQSEEMMKLYREAGTNPMASCLPLLIQSPFFMSLYGVLKRVADNKQVALITVSSGLLASASQAHVFGAKLSDTFVGGSSANVKIVAACFILVMCCSQFLTTRQLMTKNVDLSVKTPYMQQQKMMMYVLPIVYIFFGINMPVGVLIYMVTTNAWTLGQQLVIIRRNPTPGSLAFKQRQERLRAQGKLLAADGAVTSLVKGAEEATEAAAAPPQRVQPKRQTKSQRQGGATQVRQQARGAEAGEDGEQAGGSDTSGTAVSSADADAAEAVERSVPAKGKPSGGAGGSGAGGKGQSGKGGAGGQRTRSGAKAGSAAGNRSGGASRGRATAGGNRAAAGGQSSKKKS